MQTFKQLLEAFKEVPTHSKSGKPNANHPAYNTHKKVYDMQQAANKHPRMPREPKVGPDLDKIYFDLTQIIGQFYPDGDPADYFGKYYARTGINYEIARKAFKKHGYKDEYDYIASMSDDMGYANESVEELEELSRQTVGAYKTAAKADKAKHVAQHHADHDADVGDAGSGSYENSHKETKNLSNILKRKKGLERADGKNPKHTTLNNKDFHESVEELEELSKTTLGSYVKKASKEASDKSMEGSLLRHYQLHSQAKHSDLQDKAFDANEIKRKRLKGIPKAVDRLTKESETGTMRFKDFIAERADREDDEHGGGPTPAQNPDKGWKPGKSKVTKVVKEDEVNENEEKVKAHNKAVAGGYQVARKKMSQGDPAVLKKAPKGYSFNVAHKLYPVKESVFDWKKNKSEVNWKDDKDEPSTSKEGGTVYKARDHARDAANEPKKAVGRPAGEYKGNYKARAASSKKDSLAKSMASKAEGFKDRDEWKKQMHTAIMKKQLASAGLNPDDHKDAIAKKLGK